MSINKERKLTAVPTYDRTLKATPEAVGQMAAKLETDMATELEDRVASIPIGEEKQRTPEQILASLTHRVKEVESLCDRVHKPLINQIARTATLTEVSRFLNHYAPNEAYIAIQKLIKMFDNDDDWWYARRDMAVWQWAVELVPKHAGKWRKVYDTKYGPNK